MAGRKPKPTALKKLEGNPGKRKLNSNEPIPVRGMPACPEWLLPEAKAEWERLADLMNQMGVLSEVDMAAFAAYCQSYARWKEAQEHITTGGSTFETEKGYQQQSPWVGIANTNQKLMMQAASEFGLTPSSSNANTNVSMMGETFKYAAPIAGALGFSVEDTAEAIGLMANAGIKGSQAGTSLRTIMTNLSGAIDNCDGVAKKMADTMNDNLEGQLTILKSACRTLWKDWRKVLRRAKAW